jgi:Na+-transporting NADH:ubiquinone oxidoreductase subunit C
MTLRFSRWTVSYALVAPAGALIAPAPAFAVDYLTVEQAQRVLFPAADAFEPHEYSLEASLLEQLRSQLGHGLREHWPLTVARHDGAPLGVVVMDDVIGKFERITYAVAVGTDGLVKGIEILSYRESHGFEIRLAGWRRQFLGKGPGSALRLGEDISSISGATLSCQHVTDGVRRIVGVVDGLRRGGALP